MDWYNREIPRLLGKEKLFDSEGIFIGDASYVFVPDNPHYEGSVVMLFDEHNHPVDEKKLTPAQLRRCRLRRCYKWVELMHTNSSGDFFFFVAMHLGSGKANECPILYELVENFLEVVGSGVMKWLIVDRGFLGGDRIGHLKKKWKVDTVSGLRSGMAVLEDARGLLRLGPVKWQHYHPPEKKPPEALPQPPDKQSRKRQEEKAARVEKVIALTYTLLQMQLLRENRPELNRLSRRTLRHQMLPYGNHLVVYAKQYCAFFDAPEYTEIIMNIVEPGKSKLLRKIRRIRRHFLSGLQWPRGP